MSSADLELGETSPYVLHYFVDNGDFESFNFFMNNYIIKKSDEDPDDLLDIKLNLLERKDELGCTPLHLAILHGKAPYVTLLLSAGADANKKCDGNPPLNMAICCGTFKDKESGSLLILKALLAAGANPMQRDDRGYSALDWAATYGLLEMFTCCFDVATAEWQSMVQALEATRSEDEEEALKIPSPVELEDNDGNTPLHLAARNGHLSIVDKLLTPGQAWEASALCAAKNKEGSTPLHLAARGGHGPVVGRIAMVGSEALWNILDKKGHTAAEVAEQWGHQELSVALRSGNPEALAALYSQVAPSYHPPTVVIAPPECLKHLTSERPRRRGGPQPPPENPDRLRVIITPGEGILRTQPFDHLAWQEDAPLATMADLLRVHDWHYVSNIFDQCGKLLKTSEASQSRAATAAAAPAAAVSESVTATAVVASSDAGIVPDANGIGEPSASPVPPIDAKVPIGHLDSDTAISAGTAMAALKAAGAVCDAVDKVMKGEAQNVFCAVRPPGHHAGPTGVVPCSNDPSGSHGFCIFSNLAVGASYALNVYRHAGIRRVALLDFDVHHGNGTQACVANTIPNIRSVPFTTPFSQGIQHFSVCKPWLDPTSDKDSILFASVQGYGPHPYGGGWFYPGSGNTCDSRPPAQQPDVREASPEPSVPEDEGHEFDGTADPSLAAGPRIINVGVSGPGSRVRYWRRAWRDKILPAVVNHRPDMIFISAGFDAHRKDDINLRFVGLNESDFEWLTTQIVSVANKVCSGRLVSVLEGGYNVKGGVVSAFARSVAAHVRSLSEQHTHVWNLADDQAERAAEASVATKKRARASSAAAPIEKPRRRRVAPAELGEGGLEAGIVQPVILADEAAIASDQPLLPADNEGMLLG